MSPLLIAHSSPIYSPETRFLEFVGLLSLTVIDIVLWYSSELIGIEGFLLSKTVDHR